VDSHRDSSSANMRTPRKRWECSTVKYVKVVINKPEWESLLELVAKDLLSMNHQLQDRLRSNSSIHLNDVQSPAAMATGERDIPHGSIYEIIKQAG